ncbi:signal peptide peptidase SppA [Sutcliffiella rhizosphaerae]|uniref:Signal peptide peptidase SppA n=1 Tax=Sutcliffiella rhizosphaerae TaxID=2880967 RepID=A0ABN8AJL7_9BACI|nr:signal peptide peptidase SppA [Sutcliffiella rhizosphaerae]CAG9623348.1 Putative signal peptide peptidase SppA [Sutcliffiella rhizosphaerae]
MSGKRWTALGIAALLFFVSIITSVATRPSENTGADTFSSIWGSEEVFVEKVIQDGISNRKILVMEVNGVIQDTGSDVTSIFQSPGYNHRQFLKMLDQAKEDNSIQGIVVRVNTPGGGVSESAEIHKRLVEIQEETEKPIYISMGSMAASGGYYIAAPADKIFAAPETITGSIGVIMQGINYAELAENYGVKFETIKSGPYKDIMSPTKDMSSEERQILQTMVDNMYNQFVNVIAQGRDMSESDVRNIADGRIYDGQQAKEINIVDELGYFEDVIDAMKEDYDLGNVKVVQYTENLGWGSLFNMNVQSLLRPESEMQMLARLINQPNSPRLMYLYAE